MKILLNTIAIACLFLSGVHAQTFTGYAHYYSDNLQGNTTAYGEAYDRAQFTCANLKFPKNTLLRVTRLDNGRSVVVRVNDKGPFTPPDPKTGKEYIIDLSLAAANVIDLTIDGVAPVKIERVGYSQSNPNPGNSFSSSGGGVQSYGSNQLTPRGGVSSYSTTTPIPNYTQVKTINPGIGGYGIQVGSYIDRTNAEKQVVSLQKMGVQHLYLMPKPDNDNSRMLYKLVICKFDTQDQAKSYMQEIKTKHLLAGFVTRL